MWYLVNLPGNKLTSVAVKTEKNSIAADCLNKVSVSSTVNSIFIQNHYCQVKKSVRVQSLKVQKQDYQNIVHLP